MLMAKRSSLIRTVALIISAINIYRRKRLAFHLVVTLSALSVVPHLLKGRDYEQALLLLVLIVPLWLARSEFTVRSASPNWRSAMIRLTVAALVALGYGMAGFWLLDKREFGYFVLRQPGARRSREPANHSLLKWRPLRAVAGLFARLGEGLRETSRTKEFYLGFVLTLPFLALQAITLWLTMLGYGLRLSLWVGVAVFVIVNLGTAIPNTPANVGSYQFFTVLGLTLFGVDKTSATGFSLVAFTLLTLPLLVIGFLALSRSGVSLATIREELRRPGRRADHQLTEG